MSTTVRAIAVATGAVLLAACAHSAPIGRPAPTTIARATVRVTPTPPPVMTIALSLSLSLTRTATPTTVVVRYRLERRTTDAATAGFLRTVRATLADPRGWQRGDVRFVEDPHARFLIVLAEPDETQRLCRPYDVYRRFSCQNGPVVALNAERWRHATPTWTGTLALYRQMLVDHEVGHLLGLHHPNAWQCPRRGQPAPVMAQQSTELNGCLPNPWPLPAEVAVLATHALPLAPPPD